MDSTNGAMHFVSTIDSTQYDSRIAEMESKFTNFSRQVQHEGGNMDAVIQKLTQTAAAFGIGFSAVNIIKQVALTRGEFQKLEQSFQTLLGSEEQANDLMKQLVRTAATTPFDLQGVARGARQLLAYGVAADKVNEKITQLGDIASGMGLSIDYITTLYGTTISKAHMDTMDLKQFKGQGIAIDEAIAEVMEVQKERIPELITAGEVTGEIVEKAIDVLAGGQGKFAGMMANQAKSISGQISNIQDAVDSMFNELGKGSEGLISEVLSDVQLVVDNYEEVGKLLIQIASAYGAYKAVLAGVAAFQGVGARAEAIELQKLMKTQGSEQAIAVQELVTKQHLSEEEAKQIVQLREEAKERLRNLEERAAELEAIEAKALAQQRETAATLSSLQAEIEFRKMNAAALEAEGRPLAANEEYARAARLEQKAAVAQKQLDIATTNAQAATQQRATHAKKLDTFQTQMQMAMDEAHTKTTGKLTLAKEKLGKVMRATGLSMLANPVVAVTAAIAALTVVIYRSVTALSDQEKAFQKIDKAHAEAMVSVGKDNAKLHELYEALKEAKDGTEDYADAKENLLKFADKYDPSLRKELETMDDIRLMYEKTTEAVHKYYMTKFADAQKADIEEEYQKTDVKIQSRLFDAAQKLKQPASNNKEEQIKINEYNAEIDKQYEELLALMRKGGMKYHEAGSDLDKELGKSITVYDNLGGLNSFVSKLRKEANLDFHELYVELGNAVETRKAAMKHVDSYIESLVFGEQSDETKEYKKTEERWNNARKEYSRMISDGFKGVTDEARAAAEKEYEEAKKAFKDLGGNPVSVWANEQYADAKEAWETAVQNKENLLKQVREGKAVGDKILQNAIADEKIKKEAFEKLGGETSTSKSNKAQREAEKVAEERKKLAESQAQLITEASRLSTKTIENAVEKELEQIEAAYEDELKKVQKQREKVEEARKSGYIDDKQKKEYEKQLDELEASNGTIMTARNEQVQQLFKKQLDEMNTVGLKEHAKYEAERTQITEDALKKRAELQTIINRSQSVIDSENATEAEKKQAKENKARAEEAQARVDVQKGADLAKSEMEEFKHSEYYKNVFGDLQNFGETTIRIMMEKMQTFGEQIKDSLNPEDIKEFEDAMRQLQDRIIELDPFGQLSESKAKLEEALEARSEAYDKVKKASDAYNKVLKQIAAENKKEVKDEGKLVALNKQKTQALQDMTDANAEYAKTQDDVKKANNAVKKSEQAIQSVFADLADSMNAAQDTMGEMFGSVAGVINGILGVVEGCSKAMEIASSEASAAIKAVETASVILAVISAAIQVFNAANKMFGGDKARDRYNDAVEKQKEINKMEDSVASYTKAVREAERAEKNWFSTSQFSNIRDNWDAATDAMNEYHRKAEQQQVKYQDRQAGRTGLGAYVQKILNPINGVIEMTKALNVAYGVKAPFVDPEQAYDSSTVKAIDNLRFETKARKHGTWLRSGHAQKTTDLVSWAKEKYGKDLFDASGMIDVDMATQILENYEDKLVGETKETLEKLRDEAKAYQEAINNIKSAVADMYNPLVDNLTDAVWTWLDTGEDALDSFKDMASETFQSIAKEMVKTMANRLIFRDMSESLEKLTEDYAKGKMDEEEFTKRSLELVDATMVGAENDLKTIEAVADRINKKAEELGYDVTGGDSNAANAGGFETLSEQTATELSGRFSAMYIVQSEQLGVVRQIFAAMQSTLSVSTAHNGVLEDIRALQVVSNDYLATIAKSTQIVAAWESTLGNIEKYTKTLYQ